MSLSYHNTEISGIHLETYINKEKLKAIWVGGSRSQAMQGQIGGGGSVIIQKTVVEGSKTIKQSTHDGLTT